MESDEAQCEILSPNGILKSVTVLRLSDERGFFLNEQRVFELSGDDGFDERICRARARQDSGSLSEIRVDV